MCRQAIPARLVTVNAWRSRCAALLIGWALLPGAVPAKEFLPLTIPSGLVEEYSVCRWSMEDGLPDNDIRSFCFTTDGFLWCLAGQRVLRFDGVTFLPLEPPVQADGWRGVAADHAGGLWLFGVPGAYHWDGANWQTALREPVVWLHVTAEGTTWAATAHTLWRQTPQSEKSFALSSNASIQVATVDNSNRVWLATAKQLFRFEQENFHSEVLPPECEIGDGIINLAIGRDGTVWVASAEELCAKRQGRWERIPVPDDPDERGLGVTSLFAADDGVLWVGTERTLYHMRYGLWPEVLQHEQSPIRAVRCLGATSDGRLWIGSGNGLLQLQRRYIRTYLPSASLRHEAITALAVDPQGNVVAGVADAGIFQVSPAGDLAPWPQQDLPERLWIAALAFGRDGTLWVGTRGDGLWRCWEGQAEPISTGPEAQNINALLADNGGRLWVGTDRGLFSFDARNEAFSAFPDAQGHTLKQRVNTLLEDHAGRLWVGMQDGGLWQLASNTVWTHAATLAAPVLALQQDGGDVWAGTSKGLCRNQVEFLDEECVSQILADNSGHCWLGLRNDLLRVSTDQLDAWTHGQAMPSDLRRFGVNEGLPGAPITSGTGHLAVKTPDGRLWFATRRGLAMVDPWKIPEVPAANLHVHLQDIHAEDGEGHPLGPWPSVPRQPTIVQLPPGAHNVTIHFTAPYFDAPEAVLFHWGLHGLAAGDGEFSTERKAVLAQLPPGTYHLRVRASVQGSVESRTAAEALLIIAPFFWQTWWWRALLFLMGLGAALLVAQVIYRWRIRRRQQVEQLRLQIARDLHDEIGANLGSIALLLSTAEPEVLQRIRTITVQSIETLKDLVWMIDPIHDSLADMIQRMREIAADLLTGVTHEFTVTGEPANMQASLALRRNLLPIFKETLHNIRKHARAQRVTVNLTLTHDRLTLSVRDDGSGMDTTQASSGHGLRNLQQRATELGGELHITSQPDQGTTVALEIPLPHGIKIS